MRAEPCGQACPATGLCSSGVVGAAASHGVAEMWKGGGKNPTSFAQIHHSVLENNKDQKHPN